MKVVLDAVRTSYPQVLIAGRRLALGARRELYGDLSRDRKRAKDSLCYGHARRKSRHRRLPRSRKSKCVLSAHSGDHRGNGGCLESVGEVRAQARRGRDYRSSEGRGLYPAGIRRLVKTEQPGYQRAIDMLLKKIANEPFETEIPMETWDDIAPAAPLDDLRKRKIAVVTTSGVVPWGNPDRFKTFRNTFWRKYNISEVKELEPGKWEAVHGGYNVAYMNTNPHYGVPLDALRSLEAEGKIGPGKLYPAYYVIPGNQGSPAVMRRMGQEIAADLKQDGVEGVLFVAT